MKITVIRRFFKDGYTIGDVFLNGQWIANSLERALGSDREAITAGSGKAIKAGTYRVHLYISPKFHAQLPLLLNVPGRSGILIHAGNTAKDTQGCILVGQNTSVGRLTKSREAVKKIVSAMRDAEKLNEPVVITIRA